MTQQDRDRLVALKKARKGLTPGQVLVVSVVATPSPDSTLDEIAQDFTPLMCRQQRSKRV